MALMNLRLSALFLMMVTVASADLGTPASTVESVIRHARNGRIVAVDLEAVSKVPKHPYTKDQLLGLLKDIDPEKLVFQAKDKEKNIYWFPSKDDPEKSRVRLLEPRCLDFEVRYVSDPKNGCRGFFEIVGVHP